MRTPSIEYVLPNDPEDPDIAMHVDPISGAARYGVRYPRLEIDGGVFTITSRDVVVAAVAWLPVVNALLGVKDSVRPEIEAWLVLAGAACQ